MKNAISIIDPINIQISTLESMDDSDKSRKEKQSFKVGSMLFGVIDNLFKASKDLKPSIIDIFESVPEIYADVVSAANNPNCGCRGRVAKYCSLNYKMIKELLHSYMDLNDLEEDFYLNTQTLIENISQRNIDDQEAKKESQKNSIQGLETNIAGQILIIPKNKETYKALIKTINESGSIYKGISILSSESTWELFFY